MIAIKDMVMPDDCFECPMFCYECDADGESSHYEGCVLGGSASHIGDWGWTLNGNEYDIDDDKTIFKPDDCPLVEISEAVP